MHKQTSCNSLHSPESYLQALLCRSLMTPTLLSTASLICVPQRVQITTHTHTFAQHWGRTAIFANSYYWCSGSTPKSCLANMGMSKAQCQLSYLLMLVWWTAEGYDSSMSLSQGHESMAHFNTLGGSILCPSSPALNLALTLRNSKLGEIWSPSVLQRGVQS